MKKLAVLAIASYLFVACDATPGGNKVVLPVVHEEHIAPMPEHNHEGHNHPEVVETIVEQTDSLKNNAAQEVIIEEATIEAAQ